MEPIDPPSSKGNHFVIATIDYFYKYSKANFIRDAHTHQVLKFFKDHFVYRFCVPHHIISNNDSTFKSIKLNKFIKFHEID